MKFLSRFLRKATPEPQPPAAEFPKANPADNAGYKPDLKGGAVQQKKAQINPDELRLDLGDFLHRIPPQLLQPGPHDLKADLRFDIYELSRRIGQGVTTIPLVEIYKRMPQIFRAEILESDNVEIRFPWKKLAALVSDARAGAHEGKGADPAIAALAERLRSQKTNRPAKPVEKPASTSTPVLPGRGGGKDATWFSKPTIEKPAPATAEPKSNIAPVTEVPHPVDVQPREAGDAPEPISPASPQAVHAQDTPVSKTTTSRSSADDLNIPGLPHEAQRKIAMFKGEYERLISELEAARQSTAAARDRIAADLLKARQEADDLQGELAVEQTASTMSRECFQTAAKERDAAREEAAAAAKQLGELRAELAALRDESKVSELIAERDALLQQKAYLTAQAAEISKRGATAQQPRQHAENGGALAGRQVEEWQRRVAALEANQRETALELAREKEARSKSEKLLAAADKLQEQSANYMESAKNEMRQEIEASFRLRDNEARKTIKELQEQAASLSEQLRKASTELESAAPTVSASGTESLHLATIAQLEEDMESYRDRMKVLLRERDEARAAQTTSAEGSGTLRKEFEQLSVEYAMLSEQFSNNQAESQNERGKMETRAESLMQSLEAAQRSLTEKRANLEPALGNAQSEIESLRAQCADANAALEAEREKTAAQLREQSSSLEQQITSLVHERDGLREQLDALELRLSTETASREDLINSLDHEHTSVVRANEELTRKLADAESTIRELQAAHPPAGGTGLLGDPILQAEISTLRTQLADALGARDEAQKAATARDASLLESESTLNRLAAAQQQVVAELEVERAAAQQLRADIDRLRAELGTGESLAVKLAEEQANTSRLTGLLASADAALTQLRSQHAADAAERQAEIVHALGASHAAREEAQRQHEENVKSLESRVAGLEREHASSLQKVATLEQKLTLSESAQTELDELRSQFAAIESENARLREEIIASRTIPMPGAHAPQSPIIEIFEPEIVPPIPDNGVRISFIRPAPVPPPKISTL